MRPDSPRHHFSVFSASGGAAGGLTVQRARLTGPKPVPRIDTARPPRRISSSPPGRLVERRRHRHVLHDSVRPGALRATRNSNSAACPVDRIACIPGHEVRWQLRHDLSGATDTNGRMRELTAPPPLQRWSQWAGRPLQHPAPDCAANRDQRSRRHHSPVSPQPRSVPHSPTAPAPVQPRYQYLRMSIVTQPT